MIASVPKSVINYVFVMLVALLHIHVMAFSNRAVMKPGKVSGCPFKVVSNYFGRNSFLFRNPGALQSNFNALFASSSLTQYAMNPNIICEPIVDPAVSCDMASNLVPTEAYEKGRLLDSYYNSKPCVDNKVHGKSKHKSMEHLEIICLGLSHHNSGVEVREKMAIPEAYWNEAASGLCEYSSITEASVLSTCNRFEIYLAGPNKYEAIRDAVEYLSRRSNGTVDEAMLKNEMFMLEGDNAIRHLFSVASGMDSLVIGEGQILNQVKCAHKHGLEADILTEDRHNPLGPKKSIGGRGGTILSKLLKTSITCGKRVRKETGISHGATSISTVAVGLSHEYVQKDCGVPLSQAKVACIGAGKMTRLLLNPLISRGVKKVTIVNRSLDKIKTLQQNFPKIEIIPKLMDDLYNVITHSDVVFTATASEDPVIIPNPLKEALTQRTRKGGMHIIDISVPRNVHEECETISTSIKPLKCYTIDHLKPVVARNTALRRKEMVKAEYILQEEMKKFNDWQQRLDTAAAEQTTSTIQQAAGQIRAEELKKFTAELSNLTPQDKQNVERLTSSLASRFIRGPLSSLRTESEKYNQNFGMAI